MRTFSVDAQWLPRQAIVLAALVLALTLLQPILVLQLRGSAPVLAALHPVNALLIFMVAAWIGRSTKPRKAAVASI